MVQGDNVLGLPPRWHEHPASVPATAVPLVLLVEPPVAELLREPSVPPGPPDPLLCELIELAEPPPLATMFDPAAEPRWIWRADGGTPADEPVRLPSEHAPPGGAAGRDRRRTVELRLPTADFELVPGNELLLAAVADDWLGQRQTSETVRVVVENPRAVQSAAMTATKASAGRREMTGLQLSPGLILS